MLLFSVFDMISALIDERADAACERALLRRGYNVIRLPAADGLSEAVKSHPDMLIFSLGESMISSAEYCERAPYVFTDIHELYPSIKMTFTEDVFSPKYPMDAVFNVLTIGKRAFLKLDTVSSAVKELLFNRRYELISVKQGYPACTVLPIGDNAAITADRGMARAMAEKGINVTLISDGGISLPPHKYGFIGGCSGCLGKEIFFLGDYKRHQDADLIERAITDAGYTPVSLSDAPLTDHGRIIFISR